MTKLDREGSMHTLGYPVVRDDLGAGAAQRWGPRDYRFYERNWRTQRGAWGDADEAEAQLESDVEHIKAAFADKGSKAGYKLAQERGLLQAAQIYVGVRASNEESLSAKLARIRARLVRRPTLRDKLAEAFVAARLRDVRAAANRGETPPQAVRDKPQVPRKHVPRWIFFTSVTLGVIGFIRSFDRRRSRGR